MLHARADYNRIQDPENKIGEKEPVMLFRAQDKHFPAVLNFYAKLLVKEGNIEMSNMVRQQLGRVLEWQKEKGSKSPDL